MPKICKNPQENISVSDEAKRLKVFRKAEKLTQGELAEKLGSFQMSISRYEKGENSIPVDLVKKLHELMGMSLDWFFTGAGKPKAVEKSKLLVDITTLNTSNKILEHRLESLESQVKLLVREVYSLKHKV